MLGPRVRRLFARVPVALRVLKGERPTNLRGRHGFTRVGILTITEGEFEAAKSVLDLQENVPGTPYFVEELRSANDYPVVLRRAAAQGNIEAGQAVGGLVEDFR